MAALSCSLGKHIAGMSIHSVCFTVKTKLYLGVQSLSERLDHGNGLLNKQIDKMNETVIISVMKEICLDDLNVDFQS